MDIPYRGKRESEEKNVVLVSLKQIWYDVRKTSELKSVDHTDNIHCNVGHNSVFGYDI